MSDKRKVSATPMPAVMPRCWDTEANWKEWQRLNAEAKDNNAKRLDHFCHDCLPEYRDAMAKAGRCAYPTVMFVRIIERQFDAVAGMRKNVITDAVRGVRLEDTINAVRRGETTDVNEE